MSDVRDRLQKLDAVEPPEQWADIAARRPGAPVRIERGAGGRLGAAILALAVAAAGTLLAVDRLSPDPPSFASLDTSTWTSIDLPTLGVRVAYPPPWHVQTVDESVGHLGMMGAVFANVEHTFRHPDLGPNRHTSAWDLSGLPPGSVVLSLESHTGGPMVRPEHLEGSEPPLSLDDSQRGAGYGAGPGWQHRWLPFVVGDRGNGVHALFGPAASERDREIARLIVASITPLTDGSFDGWTIEVEAEHGRSGPLEIVVGPVVAAPANDARPWIRHAVVLRNTSDEPLRFDDTRIGKLLGLPGPELYAADQGCGYADLGDGRPLEWGVCLSYLDAFTIPPHGVERREITLWKDLRGLTPLAPGEYVFRKVLRYRQGSIALPYVVRLRLVYTIRRA
jgi:hypothetical protein